MAKVFSVAWSAALPGVSSQGRLPSPPSEVMLDSTRALKLSAVVRTWATLAFSRASVPSLAAERSSAITIRATMSTAAPGDGGDETITYGHQMLLRRWVPAGPARG